MNFKRIKKDNIQKEEDFLQGGRGDNEKTKSKENVVAKKPYNEKLKRKYSLCVYFDEEEYSNVKKQAEAMKMNVNQYIRFKLFVSEIK